MEHVHIGVSNMLRNVPNAKCFHIFIYIYEYILEVYIFPIQSLLNVWKHLALSTLLSFVGRGHYFGNGSRAPLSLSSGKPLSTGFGYTFILELSNMWTHCIWLQTGFHLNVFLQEEIYKGRCWVPCYNLHTENGPHNGFGQYSEKKFLEWMYEWGQYQTSNQETVKSLSSFSLPTVSVLSIVLVGRAKYANIQCIILMGW